MDIAQRYYIQKTNIRKQLGIEGLQNIDASLLLVDDEIDRYILTMIETKDKRRALLDKEEYNETLNAVEKDAQKRIEQVIDCISKEFNK